MKTNDPQDDLGYPGPLKLDVEKYRSYVDGFDISEAQKIELLHCLWNIVSEFVHLAFDENSSREVSPAVKAHMKAAQEENGTVTAANSGARVRETPRA